MRAWNSSWSPTGVVWSCACALLSLAALPACHKEVRADFPRPPATATMVPASTADAPDEPKPVDETPASPPETDAGEAPSSPEPPSSESPRPRPKPAPDTSSGGPPAPEPPPTSTQMGHADETDLDPELAKKLDRASFLLGSIGARSLTPELTEQLTAARSFVAQARQALADGDGRRAHVLIDKGLILAEDVERLSRP